MKNEARSHQGRHRGRKKPGAMRLGFSPLCAAAVVFPGRPATALAAAPAGRDDNPDDDQDRRTYAIGLWGDLPYSDVQALTGVPNLIADMNRHDLAFTAHDCDLKAGNATVGSFTPTTCSDALYLQGLNYFNSLKAPAIFTPG